MANIDNSVQTAVIKCPECLNYMRVRVLNNGTQSGKCTVCKSMVFSKQHSDRERHIKIVKCVAN